MSFLTHAREGRMVWIWEGHWKVAAGSTVVLVAWARGQGSLTPLLTQLRSIAKPPCYIRNPSVYTSIDPTAVSAIDWQERPHWSSIHSFFFFFFLATPHSMRDLSSPTKDGPRAPCSGNVSLNHWSAREVPSHPLLLPPVGSPTAARVDLTERKMNEFPTQDPEDVPHQGL